MKDKRKFIKKTILILLVIFVVVILSAAVYDRATINNQYSINDGNIDIPIFVYHNIVQSQTEVEYDYMQTTSEVFENQVKGLMDYEYHFITYEDLQKFKNNEIKLYKKSCILTFDDGDEGVYYNAYPIAKKYNIPFTMFVVTDNVGKDGFITWEQAKEMKESGLVTIASHSMDHADFSNLTVEEAVSNVQNSYKIIEEKLGNEPIKIFTYPYGIYKDEQITALENMGYIQNLTDNKINKSKHIDLSHLHRCYPLSDSTNKIVIKILYRSIRYN